MQQLKSSTSYLITITAFVFVVFFSAFSCNEKQFDERPNVLFIVVDDLRTQLGCYGDTVAITPNIDRLGEQGTLFSRAYCQQAVCLPSRASFLTGRRPDRTRVYGFYSFRRTLPTVVTLPEYFKHNGYYALSFGKVFDNHEERGMDPGSWSDPEQFPVSDKGDQYVLQTNRVGKNKKAAAVERTAGPDEIYIDGEMTTEVINTLGALPDQPFFIAIGYRKPHLPFTAPEKYWTMYDKKVLPMPANPEAPVDVPGMALHHWPELRGYTDIPESGPLSAEKIRELIHGYYASTSYIDAQVGKVLDELDRLELTKNTIVILLSDHGFHLGEHDLWGKTTNFELDARVPLIVSAPGQKKRGVSTDALVELVDLYPTLAELVDLPVPEGLEGTSFAPLLDDPDRSWKKAAFSQFPRPWRYGKEPELMGYSIRTDLYRYTEWQDFKTGEIKDRELYDHQNDPLETENVADQPVYSEQANELSLMLKGGWQKALSSE